jgi:hypothetical protein
MAVAGYMGQLVPTAARTVYNASLIAARPVQSQQQVGLLLVMGSGLQENEPEQVAAFAAALKQEFARNLLWSRVDVNAALLPHVVAWRSMGAEHHQRFKRFGVENLPVRQTMLDMMTYSDDAYREELRDSLRQSLRRLAHDGGSSMPLCVVGHGFGAVLAIDFFEELQREAKKHVTDMHAVERLKGEIGAFQEANDRLEGELLKRDRHAAALKEHVRAAHARTDLLQRQLALSHRTNWSASTRARTSPDARAADEADRAASGLDGSLRTAPGARRQLPLLWDDADSPSVGTTGTATVAGAAPVGERDRPLVSRLPPTAGSPHRPSGGGASGITHRAVALHDEVASEPIRIEVIPPAQPRLVQPFLRDAARPVRLKDNARELSAAMAWREAEAVHAVQLQAELRRQAAADAQELRVVRASLATRMLHARTAKLGALKHYRMLGLQRALCQWALLLELDGSYHAALKQAASILEEQASTLTAAVGDTQQRTVDTLLLEPQMLGELGEMRRRLQLLLRWHLLHEANDFVGLAAV